MQDNTEHPLVTMPTLEEFEAAGPVAQFLTKMLATMVDEMRRLEHKLECIENGGCEWHPGASAEPNRPENSIMGEAAERYEAGPRFGMPSGE